MPLAHVHPRRPWAIAFDDEELALSLVIAVVGAIRVFLALALHEVFGGEASVALGLLIFGLLGVIASARRS